MNEPRIGGCRILRWKANRTLRDRMQLLHDLGWMNDVPPLPQAETIGQWSVPPARVSECVGWLRRIGAVHNETPTNSVWVIIRMAMETKGLH